MASAPPASPTAVPGEQAICEMFIAGEWTRSASGETFAATSPGSGSTIGEVALGDRVGVLDEGQLVACDRPETVARSKDPRVRKLLDAVPVLPRQ